MPNRLIDATSPYLLQHAHNPVEWYPWGAEALGRARGEGKAIFLSIGYAACHWCHVMERECFENAEIAAVMNERFVCIKVDREERPDLDDLYMLATQLMTGQGGWPMSVWLTPELEPFYAGTYFPPVDGYGRPGFPRLCAALAEAWEKRRGDLLGQARKVVEAIRMHADESQAEGKASGGVETAGLLRLAVEQAADRFDTVHGGLGGAPKFPPHQALQLWVAMLANGDPKVVGISGADQRILAGKLALTLDGMKDGGIYDQVGGGFARYSTDERWLVPHFEKMLYDSAQLAGVYAEASVLLGNADYGRVARETVEFYLREMCAEEGAFYSSLDADSEGEEGKYYVWTVEDVGRALPGEADAALMREHLGVTEEGNWHESPVAGGSVLAVRVSAEALGKKYGMSAEKMRERLDGLLRKMREFRAGRVRPGLDDKILSSWNGLMLSGLAVTGRVLKEERYVRAAERLAGFLLERHMMGGELMRVSRGGGPAHTPGFLDDHAFVLNGLLDLIEAAPERDERWRAAARDLAESLLEDLQDQQGGGFFFTGPRHEELFCRMKNAADNATPSANGVAIRGLLRLGKMTKERRYEEAGLRATEAFRVALQRRPEYFPTILVGLLEGAEAGTGGEMTGQSAAWEQEGEGLRLSADAVGPLKAGSVFSLNVRVTIPEGFYIQPAEGSATATTVRVRTVGAEIVASQEWEFPAPRKMGEVEGYAGTLELKGRCVISGEAAAGEHVLRVSVAAQRCTEGSCLAPETANLDIVVQILHLS